VSVIALELERGAPMELTANHRVFSATRNGWVAAGDLQAGEVLQAQEGTVRVRSVRESARGLTSVCNLEVYARHEFFVGEERVRVHNGYGSAAGGGGEMVSLYRAVGDAELGVIRSTGRIPESLSGLAVKYFSATPEGAASYARQAVRGFGDAPYTLVETQVPRSTLPADVLLQVDRNVPAVVLPNTHLPLLGPANVWSFMPVP
jgi:hypothetical protein